VKQRVYPQLALRASRHRARRSDRRVRHRARRSETAAKGNRAGESGRRERHRARRSETAATARASSGRRPRRSPAAAPRRPRSPGGATARPAGRTLAATTTAPARRGHGWPGGR